MLCAPALASTRCYVEADTPVVAEGYEPQYYDGSIVYYDGLGHPFITAMGFRFGSLLHRRTTWVS